MIETLAPILVSAITLGSVYALMSVGLAMIWGGMGVLNLSQGALFMVGAYAAYSVGKAGGSPILGVLAAGAVCALFGTLLYLGPLRLLSRRADVGNATILVTVSVATLLENAALFTYGPRNKAVPELLPGAFRVSGAVITYNVAALTIVALLLIACVTLLLKRTRYGLAIRAVAQNSDGARLLGINPVAAFVLVMALSSALAGVGGVLLSSFYFVTPYVGQTYLLTALIVTILGGLGSVPGALLAAYLVGFVQAFVSFYLGVRWSLPVLFAAIILMLVWRPAGLAGLRQHRRL